MPTGAQRFDLGIQRGADGAAHAHHHAFAQHGRIARFEVRHQVGRHLAQARLGAHQLFQLRPARFACLALGHVFLVLEHFFHVGVQLFDVGLVDAQLGQPAFVVDRHRRAIVHRVLDVVDADVVAKHCAGVLVGAFHRCAGEADKGGLGQGIPQVLGKTV